MWIIIFFFPPFRISYEEARRETEDKQAAVEVRSSPSALEVTSCVDSRWNKDETIKNLWDPPSGGAVCSLTSHRADARRKSTGTEPSGEAIMEGRHSDANCISLSLVPSGWATNVLDRPSWKKDSVSMWRREEKKECVSADGSRFLTRKEMCESERDHWHRKMASDWLHSSSSFTSNESSVDTLFIEQLPHLVNVLHYCWLV